MYGYRSISKAQFYSLGGFANWRCVRVTRSGEWAYFYETP